MDHGDPISYLTLEPGTDVISSDGEAVGKVEHVLGDEGTDIFDGLVIDTRAGPGGRRFVDAPEVLELRERAVLLTISAAEVAGLPEPGPSPAAMEHHGTEDSESPLQHKLRRTWERISGRG